MKIEGTGKRVRIYVGEQDKVPGHREPLWETIFSMLRDEGAAGATMLRGLAGFGAHSTLLPIISQETQHDSSAIAQLGHAVACERGLPGRHEETSIRVADVDRVLLLEVVGGVAE